jgi:hypothetical protein
MSKTYLATKELGVDVTIGLRIRAELTLSVFEENDELFIEAKSKGASKSWPLNVQQCVRATLSGVGFKICLQARDAGSVRIQPYVNLLFTDVKIGGGVVLRFGRVPQDFDTNHFLSPHNGFEAEPLIQPVQNYAYFEEDTAEIDDAELEQKNL